MTECILLEITAMPAEQSRGRRHPRVVKRKMSNFPTKARAAPARTPRHQDVNGRPIEIIPPVVDLDPSTSGAPEPAVPARPPRRPKVAAKVRRTAGWGDHVRTWRVSDLSRAAYCECHDLDLRTFHQWVARLRHRFRRRSDARRQRP
jgi:hypothetical protein